LHLCEGFNKHLLSGLIYSFYSIKELFFGR